MKKTLFIKNAAIMTGCSLILRFAGILFKVWLAAKIGSEGIGLYQLVFSVYVLASTFASSGITTAVTKLLSEEAVLGRKTGIIKILRRSIELTLIISAVSFCLIFFGADFISFKFLNDIRASLSLKILSFSLPFMAVSSCIKGYFISLRRAGPPSSAQLIEQGSRIAIIMLILNYIGDFNVESALAAIMLGDTLSEGISAIYLSIVYSFSKKDLSHLNGRERPPYKIVREITKIATPITAGRYLNTTLRTIENLLVPKMLLRFSAKSNALSLFGMIKGMALPLLFFPSTLLNSVATLLIPEMSEAIAKGNVKSLKNSTEKTIFMTLILGFIFSSVFLLCGNEIGFLVYKDKNVGLLLTLLSPIVPFMYLDSICDGILKGISEQNFTLRTAACDSSIRILLIVIFVSKFGMSGFIGIMYFSNLFTCVLNVRRLVKVTNSKIHFLKEIFLPIITALLSSFIMKFILKPVISSLTLYVLFFSLGALLIYLLALYLLGALKPLKIK